MIRKELLICGNVQNVGFRFFAKLTASSLNLTGFAQNLENSNVLVQIQGTSKNIELFISKLYEGNGFSRVFSITEKTLETKLTETKFKVY
ncbi:MAG: acylphosphatase [Sarcina sp.]